MIRILGFLVLVIALAVGFSWLADRPGDMVVTFGGYQYRVTLMVAAVIITAVVAAIMIGWWLVKSIWNSPQAIARHFRVRRRDRGYQALSTGMIAAGSGDSALARRKKQEAMKLISADQEPLIHLLDAQASLLEGDHAAARAKFEAMLKDPELKLLGLRGLYLEAERVGETEAARHYARQAVEQAPQLGWASNAALETMAMNGQWDEALALVERQKATRLVDRDYADRRKAVLLTAKAFDIVEADPTGARNAAVEANRLAPDLTPASIVAAKAMFRLGDLKKGAKLLEAAWKKQPQREVADAYVHARLGDSVLDRLARAKKLAAIRQNNADSSLVVARAALEAGEFELARREAESAVRLEAREGAFLLLADIEEQETGDEGRVRQWLQRAVRAPRDPAWVADGVVADRWAPVSPVTGRLDAFEWRAPVERVGPAIEAEARAELLKLPEPKTVAASKGVEPVDAETIDAETVDIVEAEPVVVADKPKTETKSQPASPAVPVAAETPSPAPEPEQVAPADIRAAEVASVPPAEPESVPVKPASTEARPPVPAAPKPSEPPLRLVTSEAEKPSVSEDIVPIRPPDDPGVDPEDVAKPEPARFKLF